MTNILIVANIPSPNTRKLRQAVMRGCRAKELTSIFLRTRGPLNAGPEDVLWADGIIIGTTENFGYMSGQIKDFLERIYYPCLEQTQGLPVALYIKAGLDGEGAKTSIERIFNGLRWKSIQPPLVLKGDFCPEFITHCEELGALVSFGLDAGVF